MLLTRLASAAVGLPLLLLAVWFGDPGFSLLLAVVAAVAGWEALRLAGRAFASPKLLIALACAVALAQSPHFPQPAWVYVAVLGVGVALVAVPLGRTSRALRASPESIHGLGLLFLVGVLLSLYLALRVSPLGREWTLLALGSTFATDTGAYAVGRWLGRRPLAPRISPRKTVEGALAGLLAGTLAAWALVELQGLPLGLGWSLLLGLGIATAAQAGDLGESYLKRRAGVKDASGLIPGHGGLLDRLDSLLLVAPLVYVAARLAT